MLKLFKQSAVFCSLYEIILSQLKTGSLFGAAGEEQCVHCVPSLPEADEHVEHAGTHRHCQPQPIETAADYDVYSTSDHQYNGSRSQHAGSHHDRLVHHVQVGDVVIDHHRAMVVRHEVHHVGQRARDPATTLIVELFERFRCVRRRVGGSTVLDLVALLQQQSAQPAILTWINTSSQHRPLYHCRQCAAAQYTANDPYLRVVQYNATTPCNSSDQRIDPLTVKTRSLATAWKTGRQLHAFRFVAMLLLRVWHFCLAIYTLRLACRKILATDTGKRTHSCFTCPF